MSDAPKIPFTGWSAIPNRILHDIAAGRLTPEQGRVEAALYTLANDAWVVKVYLDELDRRIGWQHTTDYLYRMLVELRALRRVAFATTPGKKHPRYEIQLLYMSPPLAESASEHGPSTADDAGPSTVDSPYGTTAGNRSDQGKRAPEHGQQPTVAPGPSTNGVGPSSGEAASAVVATGSATAKDKPVRAPKDLGENNQLLTEGDSEREESPSRTCAREGVDKGHAPGLLPDVLEAVNRTRVERGEQPVKRGPGFYEALTDEDVTLSDREQAIEQTLADELDARLAEPNPEGAGA